MAVRSSQQPATRQVLLTMRSEYVEALDRLKDSGAGATRSELVDKIVGGFLADLRQRSNPQQTQQNQQGALGSLIAFLLIVVGIAAILKALGNRD